VEERKKMDSSSEDRSEERVVPRDTSDMDYTRFEPVWIREQGYPGEIPAGVQEFLDDSGQ